MTAALYFLLFAFTWLISLIPFRIIYMISDVLFLITYYLIRYRKKTVLRNLRTSFPEKPEHEIQALARAFYRHFCDFLLESVKCISISKRQINRRMKYVNINIIDDLERENKSFAIVSAHYGNWEWGMNLPQHITHKLLIIYRPLKNIPVDRLTKYMRSRLGTVMVPMEAIYREALKNRSENKLFSIWFLADQRPPRNSRLWTTFLNHEAAFFEGVEKMSRKLDLAVVFMNIQKVRRGYYEVEFKKLFDSAITTSENEITLTCVKEIEKAIKKKPEYWLWSHKRFKHARPEQIKLIAS
jgi:Kdo2-lipid IVA lauroyltransferase/acyltransferase